MDRNQIMKQLELLDSISAALKSLNDTLGVNNSNPDISIKENLRLLDSKIALIQENYTAVDKKLQHQNETIIAINQKLEKKIMLLTIINSISIAAVIALTVLQIM